MLWPFNKLVEAAGRKVLEWQTSESNTSSFGDVISLAMGRDKDKVTKPFRQHPVVYAVIRLIERNISRAEPRWLYKGEPVDDRYLPQWMLDLVNKPNLQQTDWSAFMEALSTTYEIYGEAFVLLDKADTGEVVNLWVFRPSLFRAKKDNRNYVIGWEFGSGHQREVLDLNDVIQIKNYNPDNPWRGLSDFEAIGLNINLDYMALTYSRAFFENDAIPAAIIKPKRHYSPVQRKALLEKWNNLHKGAGKTGRMHMIQGDYDVQVLSQSAKDMQFIELLNMGKKTICQAKGVSKFLIGDSDDSKYAVYREELRKFWVSTLLPKLRMYERAINTWVRTIDPYLELQLAVDHVHELEESYNDKIDKCKGLMELGVPLRYAKDIAGLEEIPELPGDDVVWVQQGKVPINYVLFNTGNTEQAEQAPQALAEAVPEEQPAIEGEVVQEPAGGEVKTHVPDDSKVIRRLRNAWLDKAKFLAGHEKKYRSKMSRLFFEIRKDILAKLSNYPDLSLAEVDVIYPDVAEQQEKLKKYVTPIYAAVYKQSAKRAYDSAQADKKALRRIHGKQDGEDDPFLEWETLWEQNMQEAAVEAVTQRMEKVVGIFDYQKDLLRNELRKALEGGYTIKEFADLIRSQEWLVGSTERAMTIARTEVNSTYEQANADYRTADPDVVGKEWSSSQDDAVRDSHMIDGEKQRLDDEFSNGLLYPCDPAGPAEEVINCRCTCLNVYDLGEI